MKKFKIPLEGYFTRDLFEFLVSIFGEMPDMAPEVFLGAEIVHNVNAVYVELRDGNLAGTCGLTISNSLPGLGGLGEVATAPSHERAGIATMLCREASRDFQNGGGQALFLGTANPSAERLYQRLGWQKINGSNVMVNTVQDASPEEYLANFFQGTGPARIRGASPSIRIPIIPLLLVEHNWCVLDVNVRMYST